MKPALKFSIIYANRDRYPITVMCKFFDVSRSGYYDFQKWIGIPDKNEDLILKIMECQEQSNRTYGYRRVHIWLEKQGIHHSKEPEKSVPICAMYTLNKYILPHQISIFCHTSPEISSHFKAQVLILFTFHLCS